MRNDNRPENLRWCTTLENNRNKDKINPKGSSRKVDQYTLEGVYMKIWASITEAYTELDVKNASGITWCCRDWNETVASSRWKWHDSLDDLTGEQWVIVEVDKNYGKPKPKKIKVSSCGRIKTHNGRITYGVRQGGYLMFAQTTGPQAGCVGFFGKCKTKEFVNHKDSNKTNNNLSNLEWATPKENSEHAALMGLMPKTNVNKRKAVRQLKDGVVIAEYPSMTEAAEKTGLSISAISGVIRGRTEKLTIWLGVDPI